MFNVFLRPFFDGFIKVNNRDENPVQTKKKKRTNTYKKT